MLPRWGRQPVPKTEGTAIDYGWHVETGQTGLLLVPGFSQRRLESYHHPRCVSEGCGLTQHPPSPADQGLQTVSLILSLSIHVFTCSTSAVCQDAHCGAALTSAFTGVAVCGPRAGDLKTDTQTHTHTLHTHTHTHTHESPLVQSVNDLMQEEAKCSGNIKDGSPPVSDGDPGRLLRGDDKRRKTKGFLGLPWWSNC